MENIIQLCLTFNQCGSKDFYHRDETFGFGDFNCNDELNNYIIR